MQKEVWKYPECRFTGNGFDRINKSCKGTVFKKHCIDCHKEFDLDCKCSGRRKLKRCKDCQKKYHISCIEETNLRVRGVRLPMQDPVSLAKNQNNQKKKFGGVLAFNSEKQRKTMMERYGRLHKHFDPVSNLNKKLANKLISKLNIEIEYEYRIGNTSYDFHIKDTNILIEYNPTVSHNQEHPFLCQVSNCFKKKQVDKEYSCKHTCIPRTYHYDRVILALKNGMVCLHFYEWDNIGYIVKTIRKALEYNKEITSKEVLINLDTESYKRKILKNKGYKMTNYIENIKPSKYKNKDCTVVCSGYEEWRKQDD